MTDDPNIIKTEVWFRNPVNYIRQMVEVPEARNIAWDRGMMVKRRINPQAFGNLYFGDAPGWQSLCIGDQGAALVDHAHGLENPLAVYPVWNYEEDDLQDLEDWIRSPSGEDKNACKGYGKPADEVPVFGQQNRIILTNLPASSMASTKILLRNIREIREDYMYMQPILHLHGSYSYAKMFAMNLGAVDIEPRTTASKGGFVIPPGKVVKAERASTVIHWVNLLDMTATDLKVPANRCIYNIKSALWAGENWARDLKFRTTSRIDLDPRDPAIRDAPSPKAILGPKSDPKIGDKVICNACSLQDNCKFYREDAVCSVADSEMSALARAFKTRDAQDVIDGVSTVLAAQAQRLERGVELEEDYGELDPEVTKIANQVFNNGVKLAKLLDPSLSKPAVAINLGAPGQQQATNPKQVIARAVKAIQQETGMPLEDITSEMIVSMMARQGGATPGPVAIESTQE